MDLPLVRFESVRILPDQTLTSTSTLRVRSQAEVAASLTTSGYDLREVREAPDRPGHELVSIAARGTTEAQHDGVLAVLDVLAAAG